MLLENTFIFDGSLGSYFGTIVATATTTTSSSFSLWTVFSQECEIAKKIYIQKDFCYQSER